MPMDFDPTFRDDRWDERLWAQAMVDLILPVPGQYGPLRVVRQAAQAVPLFGEQLLLSAPVEWTLVYEGERLWMSDTPQERLQMVAATAGMSGHILVAGGGLGLFPQYLRRYQSVGQVTVVERHPEIVALLQMTLGADAAIQIVHAPFEEFITQAAGQQFDGCYIDIHPTIDPRWLPGLNWLRNRCATLVHGPLRIWGYHWMLRELVSGLEREYLPLLRTGRHFDDDFGRDLARTLPIDWQGWPDTRVREWLVAYAAQVAWPLPQIMDDRQWMRDDR
ncbi:MAG TPA: hypothetical protein PKE45_16625 [Caldilineaceae bacterium]|mgnify:CR=1 FL=1|nr:hypothetical protein [Caldilineaceae bacterium]